MTLNLTLLTKREIYQSADFRLTNLDTNQLITDTSTKLVTLQYAEWDGLVSYTGIGRWEHRDTSEFVVEWLTGLKDAGFDDVAMRIRDRGNEWLSKIRTVGLMPRHTFILAAFKTGRPQLAVISNCEDCFGRNDLSPVPFLTISVGACSRRPRLVVTGRKRAVSRQARRRLKQLLGNVLDDAARVRRMLAEINAEAASSREAEGTVSQECSVFSFRADGRGVGAVEGPVVIRGLASGMPHPNFRELAKTLGLASPVLRGITFASSKAPVPYGRCQARTVTPPDSGGYGVRETSLKDFSSCRVVDVSEAGIMLGDGNRPTRPGESVIWTSPVDGQVMPCGFVGKPGGINNAGEVAAEANMGGACVHAVRWRAGKLLDLGCYKGGDSGGVAINGAGLVAGWVCIDPVNRGQENFRPAAWSLDKLHVLEEFGCNWGQAVDVNDAAVVLVVGYLGIQCRAIQWNPVSGTTDIIGGMTGIYPSAITAGGIVLGTASDRDGKSIAYLAKPGQRWERLGTAPGFYATGINSAGDVVGAVVRDGFERPWLSGPFHNCL
jgi:hypothetical protein